MKTVLITGASSGIGASTAKKFSENGYEVLLTGRNLDRLKQVSSSLPGPSSFFQLDLNSPENIDGFLNQLINDKPYKGTLSTLVNNAGMADWVSFDETDLNSWNQQFQVNLFGAVQLTKGLKDVLTKNNISYVVNVTSTLGLKPVSSLSAYSASKAAMISWSKSLALEWANAGVRVNAVAPGIVDTPIQSFHSESENSEARTAVNKIQPIGRVGKPEEIAEMIFFLTQKPSEWTTGSIITIDGGIGLL